MAEKHVVLIHGFMETPAMWDGMLKRISSRGWKLHTPYLAGHLPPYGEPTPASIAEYAHHVNQQIAANEGDTFILIGHSMGGYVALELAELLGKQVQAVCLFQSTASPDSAAKQADRLRAIQAAEGDKMLYARTMITSLFDAQRKEIFRDRIEKNLLEMSAMQTSDITGAIAAMRDRRDFRELLKNRYYSLYYFLGDHDVRLPLNELQEEIAHLPGAVAEIAENCGHMGHFEAADHAVQFIQRILRAEFS